MERGKIKSRVGHVISNKMDKTVVVNIIQIKNHPRYNKPIKRNKRFKAHDENNSCNIGDKVMIIESKPYSKTKRWRVSKVLEQAQAIVQE
ncbi:MAG: 30S ribosomal protein S17 [Candidatus Dadabacteria bacterium]|nr:30S ribosomal protein S17 [Candidatus Dadabacteria bacterium]NIQ15160.1 30S ribosomal protein S17 [Candidatus Dadabacteria bacterium]